MEYSNIEGSGIWFPNGFGVISANPEFEGDSYYLSNLSPCIDTGNPNYTDPDGTVFDMGAYFYNQDLCEIYGDLNGDNIINIIDIVILVNIILDIESSYNICHDINSDDSIDILDIIYIIQLIF